MLNRGRIARDDTCVLDYALTGNFMTTGKVHDLSGSHLDGTVTAAVPAYPGFVFNNSSAFITAADHANFTPILTPLSISAWINMVDATDFIIASKGIATIDGEWYFYVNSSDRLFFALYDESESTARIGRYSAAITSYQNQWTYVVATYNGGTASTDIKLYLNGVNNDTNSEEAGTFIEVAAEGHDVWIGRRSAYAEGKISEFRIDKKLLSALDIQNNYNLQKWRYGK